MDPRRIELFNERMWYGARPGIPERIKVLAAIDIALWDIKAKWLGVPVYELLGGQVPRPDPAVLVPLRVVPRGVAGDRRPSRDVTYAEWAAGARDVVARATRS